jgi:hypothetical protein
MMLPAGAANAFQDRKCVSVRSFVAGNRADALLLAVV